MLNELFELEVTCMDNEGEEKNATDSDTGEAAAASAAEAAEVAAKKAAEAVKAAEEAGKSERTFNQQEVNKIMGERTKALNEKLSALEGTYTELLEQTTLTSSSREKLQKDLEAVQAEMRTKEQQIEFEKKKAAEKYETDLGAANEAREKWQSLYETSTTERAIVDAAIKHEGFNGDDFIAYLGPKAKVVDEVDSLGEKTGRLVPKIEWKVTNQDTKEITMVLKSPDEVVELMKETHGNLFRSNVAKGIGEGTAANGAATPGGPVNQQRISTEDYMAMAKTVEGRQRLGLPALRT